MQPSDAKPFPNPQNLFNLLKDRITCLQTLFTDFRHASHKIHPWAVSSGDRADQVERRKQTAESLVETAKLTADQKTLLASHHLVAPVTKEELGRATWLLLHTIAAQYPSRPSKQQRKDVAALVDVLTRIYPCGECATHFRDIVRRNAPATSSAEELQQWTCEVHNCVNRSLGKQTFNCNFVQARWNGLDCGADMACDMTSRSSHPGPFSWI